jgi:spermidine synthase
VKPGSAPPANHSKLPSSPTKAAPLITQETRTVFALAVALSGLSALIYQVVWARQLSLVVGSEIYSITIAVSAFFAGLAVGGLFLGRAADRAASTARLYAAVELAIAVMAIGSTFLLSNAAIPFNWMQKHFGVLAWLVPVALVGFPCFAMGGTLPIAVRSLQSEDEKAAEEGGLLYAANTSGGIAGALAASFLLIPRFGLLGTAMVAAAMNLLAGILVYWRTAKNVRTDFLTSSVPRHNTDKIRLSLPVVVYAFAGTIALGYEVIWTQAVGQFVSTRAFSFSIVLAIYLSGLAVGAWLGTRLVGDVRASWRIFGLLIAGAALIAMLEFTLMGPWMVNAQFAVGRAVLSVTGNQAARMYTSFLSAGLGLVFLPTVLLGVAFPLALRLVVGDRCWVGRDVGVVIATNTAGGIAGTMLTGFVMVPMLGLVRTLSILTIAGAMLGAILAVSSGTRTIQIITVVVAIATTTAAIMTPTDRLANLLLATRGGGMLVYYEEALGATVAVAQQHFKDNVFRRLYIQGVSNSGDAMPSMRYMRLQAMVPLLIHRGEPESVLIIGFGTGITAGETLRYPSLQTRVCVELLPSVVRSGQMFPENYKAWSDPRMEIRIGDGRQELSRNNEKYDVITLEPPPPSAQGVANLYSVEFYEVARDRLAPHGLIAQWLPLTTQNDRETRQLVRSFLDVFPYATLWTTELHEMMLVGSDSPITIDPREIQERFSPPTVVASLRAIGVGSPAALLATWVTGHEGLEKFAADAKPVTDNNPRVEYGPWVRSDEITRVLPDMLAVQTDVPLDSADPDLRAEIQTRRQALADFYAAGLAAYQGNHEAWEAAIKRVQAEEPENAYFSYVIGRD